MLFSLSPAATAENWLRDVLNDALARGFARIDANQAASGWLDGTPQAKRERLEKRKKLGEAVEAIFDAYRDLNAAGRDLVLEAFDDQQNIADLFDGNRTANTLVDLPATMRAPLKEYADRVFDVLDEWGIRDRSYAIHDEGGASACPFCGYEAMDCSRIRNMDWDHYLAKTLYPFAGADLRNLSPMGDGCNGSFKRAKDVLRSNGGLRRACFDPYGELQASMHLQNSVMFARGHGNELPVWKISFVGDQDRRDTWESVFVLRTRWLGRLDDIYSYCLSQFGDLHKGELLSAAEVVGKLQKLKDAEGHPKRMPGSFLKAAVFDLLRDRALKSTVEGAHVLRLLQIATLPVPVYPDIVVTFDEAAGAA